MVSSTWQAGLRGAAPIVGGHVDWRLGAYRSDNDDDIVALASALQGRGSFANAPRTRRQGFEAEVNFKRRALERLCFGEPHRGDLPVLRRPALAQQSVRG